jgi:hypothetical protein
VVAGGGWTGFTGAATWGIITAGAASAGWASCGVAEREARC